MKTNKKVLVCVAIAFFSLILSINNSKAHAVTDLTKSISNPPNVTRVSTPWVIKSETWNYISDEMVPGSELAFIAEVGQIGDLGIYRIPPHMQTTVFSFEALDDGTADEFYGPRDEFYYVIAGEITLYWGHDAAKVKSGTSDKLVLREGDVGCWVPGLKYSVKNTGEGTAKFFWGMTKKLPGIKGRANTSDSDYYKK